MPEGRFDLGKGLGECIRLQLGAELAGDLCKRKDSAYPLFVGAVFRHDGGQRDAISAGRGLRPWPRNR